MSENNAGVEFDMGDLYPEKKGKYILINAYDDIVRSSVRELMSKSDMCRCDKCFLDICAIVFNRKYSRFVTTTEGQLLSKVPQISYGGQVEMTVTILDAIKMVRDFPKHEEE